MGEGDAAQPGAQFLRIALAPFGERAGRHPGGLVDLSVGTPVDPTPEPVQAALRGAADAPGYPTAAGRPELREACARWLGAAIACGALFLVLKVIEFVAKYEAGMEGVINDVATIVGTELDAAKAPAFVEEQLNDMKKTLATN